MEKRNIKWTTAATIGAFSFILTACSSGPVSISLPALAHTNAKTHGQVIWRDLATTAPEKVKPFYHNVFGWDYQTVSDDYSLITYQGNYIAGIAKMPANNSTNYWMPVISTNDIDLTLLKSEQAGGKTLLGNTNLKGRGEFAVIQDPQGAVFSVLNTVSGDPKALPKLNGSWMWQEVWSEDTVKSHNFYQKLGHFTYNTKKFGSHEYPYLSISDQPSFGFVQKPNSEVPTTWANYIKVADVDATVAKVKQNGGDVLMMPTAKVRNGTVAIIRDPAGAGLVIQEMK
ncbi:MAG: VOC family protein [Vibrio sp.]